jgi:hypothetical protein
MNIPQAALFMTLYENMKNYLFADGKSHIAGVFACAGISGAIASGITTPMDVVKTRLQTQTEECKILRSKDLEAIIKITGCRKPVCRRSGENPCGKPRYCTIKGTIKLIIKEEGFKSMYSGMFHRMMYVLPGAAVSWGAYEYIKSLLIN